MKRRKTRPLKKEPLDSRRITFLLPHRRRTALADLFTLGLLFVDTASQELGVVVAIRGSQVSGAVKKCRIYAMENLRSLTSSLRTTALDGEPVTLVLKTLGSNQTLDTGGLGVVLLALAGDGTADDELADVILVVETEETTDLGGTLGTQTLGDNGVGQTGQLALTLLDDAESQDGKVEVGDGTTDRLALALTSAAGAVAAVAVGQEETGTSREENCSK